MAWTRETKHNPIIDASYGVVTTWDGTIFNWENLTTAQWGRSWLKGVKPAQGWTREI